MITLDAATADAFKRRQIRIEPILEVSADADPSTATWQRVPNSSVIGRPARQFSPIIQRSPVVRLDLEVVASAAMKALVLEGSLIRYREVVNGQTFDRFLGNLERPVGGANWSTGAMVETLKAVAYSRSQRLKALDYERIFTATTDGPAVGYGVRLGFIVKQVSETSEKASSGDDFLAMDHCFNPNAMIGGVDYRAIIFTEGTTTYHGGTDFNVVVSSSPNSLAVHWTGASPPATTRYILSVFQVVAFFIPDATHGQETWPVAGATFNTAPVVHKLDATVAGAGEFAPEMITQTALPRIARFSPSKSHPVFYARANGGTGVAAEDQKAEEWSIDFTTGLIRYVPDPGSSGVKRIFSGVATPTVTTDVPWVGALNLFWVLPTSGNNTLDAALGDLYRNIAVDENTFDYFQPGHVATGIALGDYRLKAKGDVALKTLLANVAPNWCVYDRPDGWAHGRYIAQSLTPDLALTQLVAVRDVELQQTGQTPDVYTMVRVRSLIESGRTVTVGSDFDMLGAFPNIDLTAWSGWVKLYYSNALAATPTTTLADGTTGAYLAFGAVSNSNMVEVLRSITITFEGEIRVFRSLKFDARADLGVIPTEGEREYLVGYERANTASGAQVTATITIPDLSERGECSRQAETVWIEVRNCTRSTAKVYRVSAVVDRYVVGIACVTDEAATYGADGWATKTITGTVPMGDLSIRTKLGGASSAEATAFLTRWMLYPQSYAAAGFTGSPQSGTSNDFYWQWWRHRVLTLDLPSLPLNGTAAVPGAADIAQAYLADILRRATAKEVDVVAEPSVELGDTVALTLPDGTVKSYTVVGMRDANNLDEPRMTLELADFS